MAPLSRSVFTKTLNYLHGIDPQSKRMPQHPRMTNTHPAVNTSKPTRPKEKEESKDE